MLDPTNSRYRYLSFKGSGTYRRYVQDDKRLQQVDVNYQNNDVPSHGSYGALLFTPQWTAKRLEILKRDAHTCVVCKSAIGLQVHHRQYHFIVRQNQFRLPWEYPNDLLITLCESCHKKGHSKFKVPTVNI